MENLNKFLGLPPQKMYVKVAKYYPGKPIPCIEGYQTILIHTKANNIGGDLSPYQLKTDEGYLLENLWQFQKVYEKVNEQHTPLSRFHKDKIIWSHPAERHIENGELNNKYWEWRQKGFENEYAVRYPNGFYGRHHCLYAYWKNPETGEYEKLDYINSRKKIYCDMYKKNVHKSKHFKILRKMLSEGKKLLITEVDGPDPTLNYGPYKNINPQNPGMDMDEETIKFLVNDPKKPFGHGFVVAALLLDGEEWMN